MNTRTIEYDREAPSYDKSRFRSRLGQHLDYMHKRIVEAFLHSAGELVLDAGVGTGRFATWLSEKCYRVVGIDLSREMLKEAKKKARSMNEVMGLIRGDVAFLPFRTGVFDSCISINVIDHVSDPHKFLGEVRSVMKPEGSFIFNFSNSHSIYLPIAIIVNSSYRALFKRGEIRSRWFTRGGVIALLSRDGFEIKDVRGCFIASPLPFGDRLAGIIRLVNLFAENSVLKLLSGSIFVRSQLVYHRI
jgi:ubiquinone/menaquinone biosynthesis C-methylase UbiE